MPVLVAIWLLMCIQGAGADLPVVVARIGGDRQLRAGIETFDHLVYVVLRDGELAPSSASWW